MKLLYKTFLMGTALLSIHHWAIADSKSNNAITYPKPGGIICDKKSGFCVGEQGVSVAITEMELGKKASKNLMDQIRTVGIENFDATTFTMTGGLYCETKQRKCFTNKFDKIIDVKTTKALFGN